MSTRLLLLTALLLALPGCDDAEPDDLSGVVEGERAAFGGGTARAWVERDDAGTPVRLGLSFDEAAFSSLTGGNTGGGEVALDLSLPAVEGLPFAFVQAGWNPQGHDPEGLFTVPHFDVHFYRISEAERAQVDPARPDWEEMQNAEPEATEVPEAYVSTVEAVPFMGVHWIDPTDPTYGGAPFTEVLLYGFWGGDMTFIEPMITAAFLADRPSYEESLKLPQRYPEPGYYPTRYRVRYDAEAQEYVVALEGFVRRD